MLKEFKDFISKGNVLDLAIAVVMGAAFGKIVSSLVENIITPIMGMLLGKDNLSSLSIGTIQYGLFLQAVIDFLIISFAIFIFVKIANTIFRKKEEQKEEEVVEVPATEQYLKEIRDLLQQNSRQEERQ